MNFFAPPPEYIADVFCKIPDNLRCTGQHTDWRGGNNLALSIFLEGPTTDAQGNLFIVDIPYGRIIKIDSITRKIEVQAQWDGEPNGLAITHDGYMLVADYKRGLLVYDPADNTVRPYLPRRNLECWKGLNDLVIDSKGNTYFTDQGQTGMSDPTGGVYCLSSQGILTQLIDNGVSPNGIVLSPDEKWLYVAMTRSNSVWRMPLHSDGSTTKANLFFQSFGNSGPDGLTIDSEGNLFICHPSLATVFVVDKHGLPVCRIKGKGATLVTNAIFGGPNNDILYFTDSLNGNVFSHQWHCSGATPIRQSRAKTNPFNQSGHLQSLAITQPSIYAATVIPTNAEPINTKLSSADTVSFHALQDGYHTPNTEEGSSDINEEEVLPFKVYAPDNFHPAGLKRAKELFKTVITLADDGEEANNWPTDADGIMSRAKPIRAEQIESSQKLVCISKQGVGVDTIDVEAAKSKGVTIVNTPGINADAVAELTYGLVLSLKRRITEADRRIRSGQKIIATDCMGSGVQGKVLALIGMGNIGKATAKLFSNASQCQIVAYDPYAPSSAWSDLKHKRVNTVEEILKEADIVSLHLPLLDSTRNMIGKEQFKLMKRNAVIVNASRGGIIDETALFEALSENRIGGAALDALESEPASMEKYGKTLYTLSNIVLTPHLGAATDEVQAASAIAVAENLATVLAKRTPPKEFFNRVV